MLEHTAVGDAGLLHLAQLPRLRSLTLSNFISSLGHLSFLPGGPHVRCGGALCFGCASCSCGFPFLLLQLLPPLSAAAGHAT